MKKCLFLILELERDEETGPLYQIVSVILCCTLNDLLIILEFIALQNIACDVIFEGIIINRLLISFCVILYRAHSVWGHRPFIYAPKGLKIVLIVRFFILIKLIILGSISLCMFDVVQSWWSLTFSFVIINLLDLILTYNVTSLPNQLWLLNSSLLHSENFFHADTFHINFHWAEYKITSTSLQILMGFFADENFAWRALWANSCCLINCRSN